MNTFLIIWFLCGVASVIVWGLISYHDMDKFYDFDEENDYYEFSIFNLFLFSLLLIFGCLSFFVSAVFIFNIYNAKIDKFLEAVWSTHVFKIRKRK